MAFDEDLRAKAQAALDRRRAQQAPVESVEPGIEDLKAKAQAELDRRRALAAANQEVPQQQPVQSQPPTDLQAQAQAALDRKRGQPTPPSQPIDEDNGFFSNVGTGSGHGKEDLDRQMTVLGKLMSGEVPEPIPVPHGAELDFSRKGIGQFIGRTATSAGPAIGASLVGAKIGAASGALAGPVGATIGGFAGGATTGGVVGTAQSYADAYNEARLAGQEHEKALEYASKIAKVSGGINVIASGLGGVGLKDQFIKHALKQIPIQTAVANAENITRNIVAKNEGVDPDRELLAGTKEATFGPGAMHVLQAAGTKAAIGAKNLVKGKPAPVLNEPIASIASKTTPESQIESQKPIVPGGTVVEESSTKAKPRARYDKESQTWVPVEKLTEKSTVIPAEETNLGRKKGATEEQKVAADVNLDEVHQKIYGNTEPEKPPSFIQKIADKAKNIAKENFTQASLMDAHAPIKEMGQKAGIKTPGENPAYRGSRFARNVSGMLKSAYDHGRPYWDKTMQIMRVNTDAPGFSTIIRNVAKTPKMLKDFQTYAYARRVKTNNLIEHGKEQNMQHHEVDAAINLEQAHPEFKQAFDEIQEYNKAVLDVMEDTGLINKDKRAQWEEMDYVPFYRELGESLGVHVTNKGKGLTGQKAKIKPLKGEKKMWQVMDEKGKEIGRFPNEQEAIQTAAKHDLNVADEHVGHQTGDVIENLYKNISSFLPAAMKNAAAVDTLRLAVDTGVAEKISAKNSMDALGRKHSDVVTVMEGGEPVHYKVLDKDMYKAVTESYLPTAERGAFGKTMQAVKGVFSTAVVTQPAVAIGIAAKDIIQSGLVGKYSMGNIKGILVDLPKELIKAYGHEFGIKTDKRLVDISAMGAESRFSDVSPEMRQRQMERAMEKHKGKMLTWVNKDSLRTLVDRIITPAENANRLRKFEAARKAGKDIATAGYESLDYMDYGKKGSGGFSKFLRDFVPFAGSHMSSSHTLGTELAHNKGANPTTAKLFTLAAFSGANAWHNLDDTNDPDPSNGYMALPDYVRDNNWCIDTYKFSNGDERFKNGDTRWIMIPKPWEAGQLGGSVIENLMAVYKGKEDGKDINRYIMKQFTDYLTINPFGHPIVKTLYEERANKQDFLNMPIVPRQTEELAPFLQYGPKTSETAKKLGEATNFSPARIEHIGKGILGSYADYLFMAGDLIVKGDKGESPDKSIDQKYIFNKFVKGTPLERTVYENELYDLYLSTKQAYKTLKELEKHHPEKVEKFHKENAPLIAKQSFADNARKEIKEFDNHRKKILEDKSLSGSEKKKQIDEVLKAKNSYLYQFHQQMKEDKKRK